MKIKESYYVRIIDSDGKIKEIKDFRIEWYRGKTVLIWRDGNLTIH